MIVETLVCHGSDWIEWIDASGWDDAPARPVDPGRLAFTVSKAPADLTLVHKRAGTALWRQRPAGLIAVFAGMPTEAELAPPAQAAYQVAGSLADPSGVYLPRAFSVSAGSAQGHRFKLYRSPQGQPLSRGGLRGRFAREDGTDLPWALARLEVTTPLGPKLRFTAQADARGEFALPLGRLPAPVPGEPATYAAVFTVLANLAARVAEPLDPAALPAAKVVASRNAQNKRVFANKINLQVKPGAVAALVSPGEDRLVLKPA